MLEYHAAYYRFKKDDGWYIVSMLDFPGVNTQGRTLREARFMIKDALQLMVECYLEEGRKLPKPNPKAKDRAAKRIEIVWLQVQVRQRCRHEANEHLHRHGCKGEASQAVNS